ncbi:MAG: GDP-mannose 4,6-dehydratase [Candidatus Pacebacteria bacterium CG_4_10_14_0_8_um_filter_43_12]|nr:MAG: GDP-mannose 4,6-dehydratase [Candidatus Pacebacteria bacterium CG_4_10_14_0_8_um_filter_43_12]
MNDLNSGSTLITGGTGFAGSHLIEYLLNQQLVNPELLHTTYYSDVPDYLAHRLPAQNFHKIDLTSIQATNQLLALIQPKFIYHLAAFASVGNSFEKSRQAVLNNISLQLNLLEAIQNQVHQARLLLIGSAESYGISQPDELPIKEDHPFRPVNPYGVSKLAQEMLGYAYAQSWQLDIVRVRPFNHIGERQTADFAIPSFAKQIVAIERGHQPTLKVGNLDAIRDFTDVKDMVKAYQLLVATGISGEVYNIGSGQGKTMKEVVELLCSLSTVSIHVEVDQSKLRPLDIPVVIANNERVRQLGWQPTISLLSSLQRVLEYWRAQ